MLPYLYEAISKNPEIAPHEPVRIDILKRFGYFSTESNGHLSEYLPWYRKRPEELAALDLSRRPGSTGPRRAI